MPARRPRQNRVRVEPRPNFVRIPAVEFGDCRRKGQGQREMKPKILSGIQPSGVLHIGNYFGAIENWVRLMDDYECFFMIVDYHAMTIEYDQKEMPGRIFDAALVNIAAGLNPERCHLFVQSHVPEHAELCWILNCVTPMGELSRMTQFKEKSKQHSQNINAGLLNYPILQAADILIYKAAAVPVGDDQAQHIEFTREVARRFNLRFGDVFPEPKTLIGRGARIMGLDGKSKMSKSLDNYIAITETEEDLWKKLAPAVTDENRKRRTDPGNPLICNIYSMHELVTPEAELKECAEGCRTAGIGCIDCKRVLLTHMNRVLAPIRERKAELESNPEFVRNALRQGAADARAVARVTMKEVREAVGIGWPFD